MAEPAAGHLGRDAYIYVRQSTLTQTVRNTESLLRQYDLAGRARQPGWAEHQIVVVDDDLGRSGASAQGRKGFSDLVADVDAVDIPARTSASPFHARTGFGSRLRPWRRDHITHLSGAHCCERRHRQVSQPPRDGGINPVRSVLRSREAGSAGRRCAAVSGSACPSSPEGGWRRP
jgi:hypothetical protein